MNQNEKILNVLCSSVELQQEAEELRKRNRHLQEELSASYNKRSEINDKAVELQKKLDAATTWQPIGTAPTDKLILLRGGIIYNNVSKEVIDNNHVVVGIREPTSPGDYILTFIGDNSYYLTKPEEWLPIIG